jgi:hypothetical protein
MNAYSPNLLKGQKAKALPGMPTAGKISSARNPLFCRACHAETFFVPYSAMTRWV